MDKILDWLFQSSLGVAQSEDYRQKYSADLENILRAEKDAKAKLSDEQWALVNDYLERIRELQVLDCRLQFERGLLLGAKIMLWVAEQEMLPPEQS